MKKKRKLDTVGGRKFAALIFCVSVGISLIVSGFVAGKDGWKGIVTLGIAYIAGNVANKFVGRFTNGSDYEESDDNPRISE